MILALHEGETKWAFHLLCITLPLWKHWVASTFAMRHKVPDLWLSGHGSSTHSREEPEDWHGKRLKETWERIQVWGRMGLFFFDTKSPVSPPSPPPLLPLRYFLFFPPVFLPPSCSCLSFVYVFPLLFSSVDSFSPVSSYPSSFVLSVPFPALSMSQSLTCVLV